MYMAWNWIKEKSPVIRESERRRGEDHDAWEHSTFEIIV
jgi:hypothetical protein